MAKTNVRGTQIADGAAGVDLTVDVFGTLPTANGGTGLSTPGATGNVLTSNGSVWVSAPAGSTSSGGSVPTTMQANLTVADYTQMLFRRPIKAAAGLLIIIGQDAVLVGA